MKHETLEKNATLLLIFSFLVVTIGGLVQIVPLFYLQNTIENVEGMRPYSPLELAGRNVYIREGCYVCHSQMIRPFRDEVERYGHYSLAAESQYDHPFQWGSKRTGPDLARVGNKYSDDWHKEHMANPRNVVPESIMPGFAFLLDKEVQVKGFGRHLAALNLTVNNGKGAMYRPEDIENAEADMIAQATGENAEGLLARYPKALARNFDGDPRITEMDALIAYLQMLGTLVDTAAFTPELSR
ncbi:cytochrome-c oxidase, cbb3-type subunit II [Aestuariivirga sp.]|jgi:cytochrome c oxidase cbb3-type subunit 2|uniref:cytochrome-c oxidase, cbb3-type subunit II n=1 Tax=Aestuariivirga sp. TaxID=2650926 RepID=UPI003783B7CC